MIQASFGIPELDERVRRVDGIGVKCFGRHHLWWGWCQGKGTLRVVLASPPPCSEAGVLVESNGRQDARGVFVESNGRQDAPSRASHGATWGNMHRAARARYTCARAGGADGCGSGDLGALLGLDDEMSNGVMRLARHFDLRR